MDNVKIEQIKEFASSPFPVTEEQLAVAVEYRNKAFIADEALPVVRTGKQEFSYQTFEKKDSFTIPKTESSRKGGLNTLELSGTETTDKTIDYGLQALIPQNDIDNTEFDLVNHYIQKIMELVNLDHEKRVADMVFNSSNYASGNKTTLSGNSQWSDFTNSTPLKDILDGFDACLMRPNVGIIGQQVWTKLRQHPDVVKAIGGNSGDSGIVPVRAVADLLELDELYIGSANYNTANRGQTFSKAFLFGKHACFFYRDTASIPQLQTSQFFTAQFGDPVVYTAPLNPGDLGLSGGVKVVAGRRLKEVKTATDLGYLFINAVA